jgi:hypothetical protein
MGTGFQENAASRDPRAFRDNERGILEHAQVLHHPETSQSRVVAPARRAFWPSRLKSLSSSSGAVGSASALKDRVHASICDYLVTCQWPRPKVSISPSAPVGKAVFVDPAPYGWTAPNGMG